MAEFHWHNIPIRVYIPRGRSRFNPLIILENLYYAIVYFSLGSRFRPIKKDQIEIYSNSRDNGNLKILKNEEKKKDHI